MKPFAPDIIEAIRAGVDPADCFARLLQEHCGGTAASIWADVQRELGREATRPHDHGPELLRSCDGCRRNVPVHEMSLHGGARLCRACAALCEVQP